MDDRAGTLRAEMAEEFLDLDYDQHQVAATRGVLELAARQLRAFARGVTASRMEADQLVEDTLLLYLSEDRDLQDCEACFTDLVDVFRRVCAGRSASPHFGAAPDPGYAGVLLLTMPEREVAVMVIGGNIALKETARMLRLDLAEADRLLKNAREKLGEAGIPLWPFVAECAASDGDGSGATG